MNSDENENETTMEPSSSSEAKEKVVAPRPSFRSHDQISLLFECMVLFFLITITPMGLQQIAALAAYLLDIASITIDIELSRQAQNLVGLICNSIVAIVLVFLAISIRGERKEDFGLGLQTKKIWKELPIGLLTFVMMLTVSILAATVISFFADLESLNEQKLRGIMELFSPGLLVPMLLSFIPIVFYEELFFRSYLIRRFRQVSGSAFLAVMVSATLFGMLHGYQGFLGMIVTTLWGALLGLVYLWRKSLVPIYIAHLINNTAIVLFLYYAPTT